MQYTRLSPPRNTPRIIRRIALRAYVRGWLPLGVLAWLCRRGAR